MRISDWSSDVCSSDLLGGAHRLGEIMGGEADAPFRRRQAEIAPHRPAEPGIDGRVRRPAPFVEAAEDQEVGMLQPCLKRAPDGRSEEHTSELQSLMRISYAVFCLKKNTITCHT